MLPFEKEETNERSPVRAKPLSHLFQEAVLCTCARGALIFLLLPLAALQMGAERAKIHLSLFRAALFFAVHYDE